MTTETKKKITSEDAMNLAKEIGSEVFYSFNMASVIMLDLTFSEYEVLNSFIKKCKIAREGK